MANLVLDISNYRETHHAMWLATTKVSAGGYRYCDGTSTVEHVVTVRDGGDGPSVRLFMKEFNLYIVGFENAAGSVFAFADQEPKTFSKKLNMSVNYAHVPQAAKKSIIDRAAVVKAITTFSGHTGDAWAALSEPFLIMALLVSESMRFKRIFEMMARVVSAGGSVSTKFNDWYKISSDVTDLSDLQEANTDTDVTQWSSTTTSLHNLPKLMDKPSRQPVIKTWHRFER